MAFVKEELKELFEDADLQAKHAQAKRRQVKERQYVGQQMAELENDPRWRIFDQHINALKEPHRGRVADFERKLGNSVYLSQEDYTKTRFELLKARTAFETLEQVQMLIRHLIEDGKAVGE